MGYMNLEDIAITAVAQVRGLSFLEAERNYLTEANQVQKMLRYLAAEQDYLTKVEDRNTSFIDEAKWLAEFIVTFKLKYLK